MTKARNSRSRFLWMLCCALVGLMLGAGLTWWGFVFNQERVHAETIQRLNEQLAHATMQLNELHAERGVLEGKLAVESSTRQGLERTLGTIQQELGAARDQIAFFSELIPPGPEGSVSIRGFDIQPQGRLLHFRVLLMRHGAGDQPFEGMLQFQATGRLAGEPLTLTLEPARLRDPNGSAPAENGNSDNPGSEITGDMPSSPILALRFDQFQRSSGLLHVPEGVELESVTLNVLEGDTLRVSRTVDIPLRSALH